ncbi:hypothetical protein SynSYN20_00338 [Synechococcus sp. SYN20]|nr:hypothetical protein SynSYN20_00338 [Synechococcus sp. SYN20]
MILAFHLCNYRVSGNAVDQEKFLGHCRENALISDYKKGDLEITFLPQ